MIKNKLLLFAIFAGVAIMPAVADEISDIQFPKPPAYRVGISSVPENQYVEAVKSEDLAIRNYTKLGDSEKEETTDVSYADLSIKRLSKEIAQDLEYEESDMVADLSLLWQGAATQSDTINFALYKLANPDADKPDKNSLKKVLTTIASMSTLVGAGIGNPIIAGSSLIGGNILGIMSQDTKALNYKYTKVTDADMIILIRKVEDLQQTAVNLYYDYMSAKKQLEMATKLVEERGKKFELAQKNNAQRELVVISDAYYRSALDKQRTAKSDFFAKRAALEQFVGNSTFVQFEEELAARENGVKTAYTPASDVKTDVVTPIYNQPPKQQAYNMNNYMDDEEDDFLKAKDELAPLPMLKEESNEKLAMDKKKSTSSKPKIKVKKQDKIQKLEKNNIEKDNNEPEDEISMPSKKDKTKVSKDKKVKEPKVPKKKVDKYTTKGFIFLHNNEHHQSDVPGMKRRQKQTVKDSGKVNVKQTNNKTTNSQKVNNGLLPLDEIKIPEIRNHGYSIHDSEE